MPLSLEQIDDLQKTLATLAKELAAALDGTAAAARPIELDQPAVGRVSRIDAIQQQKMLEANRESQRIRLQLTKSALRRIDEGEFGECQQCGEDIGVDRLRARPESLYCIECQSARER